jgi:DNA repair exonuclease SbcCD ATPase subunit
VIARDLQIGGLCLLVVLTLTGCRPQGGATPVPTVTPAPAAAVTPSHVRIGVVDFNAVVRAHRRWPELDAIQRKMDALQFRLHNPPPPPEIQVVVIQPSPNINLQAEADQLRKALSDELNALQEEKRREIEAYVNEVKAEHEAALADRQKELNEELQKSLEAKRDELQRELDRFELATMAEYRIPLANMRVKDAVPPSSEEEAKKLSAEADRIQKERDEKIRTKAQALEKDLNEFRKAKTTEAEAKFNAMIEAAEQEVKTKAEAKQDAFNAEMRAAVADREQTFRNAMESRQKLIQTGKQVVDRSAQDRYIRQVRAEQARIQAELQALQAQQIRLQDSILAEVKIEVATVAQEKRVDVVLTHSISSIRTLDLTPAVIAKLKRS